MTAPGFTAHGKQVLALGAHYADAADTKAAEFIAEACNVKAKGWQPIETAPRDQTEILIYGVWASFPTMHVAQWRRGEWKVDTEDGFWAVDVTPTHWMPLPSAPVQS